MAEAVLLKDCKVYFGGYDLTGAVNGIKVAAGKAQLNNGRMGDGGEVFNHGLQQIAGNVKGFWSAAATGLEPDNVLWASFDPAIAAPTDWPLVFAPPFAPAAAAGADGNLAYTMVGGTFTNKHGAAHGENLPFEFDAKLSSLNALYRGSIAIPKTTITVTTTGVGQQLGILAADEQMVVAVQAFAITGGSWVVTLESDDNGGFATPTVRDTFSAITTAPTRAVRKVVGPIATDDRWRLVVTKTGGTNLTLVATFGKAARV